MTQPRGSLLVELSVGALLTLVALAAMLAGGWFSVTTSDAAGTAPAGATAPSALILQCPLGVHRLPLVSRSQRSDA